MGCTQPAARILHGLAPAGANMHANTCPHAMAMKDSCRWEADQARGLRVPHLCMAGTAARQAPARARRWMPAAGRRTPCAGPPAGPSARAARHGPAPPHTPATCSTAHIHTCKSFLSSAQLWHLRTWNGSSVSTKPAPRPSGWPSTPHRAHHRTRSRAASQRPTGSAYTRACRNHNAAPNTDSRPSRAATGRPFRKLSPAPARPPA